MDINVIYSIFVCGSSLLFEMEDEMKKRILCVLIAIVLLLLYAPAVFAAEGSLSNFYYQYSYSDGRFKDVSSSDWFADSVKAAYRYGLVNGVSSTRYAPDSNVTIAETITLASRINSIYYGRNIGLDVADGKEWYKPYIDYAMAHGIVNKGDYKDYKAVANRQQFAYLMAKALPA